MTHRLQGLPDFGSVERGPGPAICLPFQGRGPAKVLPDRLRIPVGPDGLPAVALRRVRPSRPDRPPAPHAMFEIQLELVYPLIEAMTELRSRQPDMGLQTAPLARGILRMFPVGESLDFPDELRIPQPLGLAAPSLVDFRTQLDEDAAGLVRAMLQDGDMPITALAELEFRGVAATLPVQVQVQGPQLEAGLAGLTDEDGLLCRDELEAALESAHDAFGISIEQGMAPASDLAAAVLDRLRSRLAVAAPSPRRDRRAWWRLEDRDRTLSGQQIWDLSQPEVTWRPLSLRLDAAAEIRRAMARHGQLAVIPEPVTVPALSLGWHEIEVAANLPRARSADMAIGVQLEVPARPPHRSRVTAAVELGPEESTAALTLRLSPGEALAYNVQTFVVADLGHGPQRLDSVMRPAADTFLHLRPNDFPVRFLLFEATDDVLALAEITGRCEWETGSASCTLDPERRVGVVAMPWEVETWEWRIEATARRDGATLGVTCGASEAVQIGLHTFPDFGPQSVAVSCRFDSPARLLAIELTPEGEEGNPERHTIFSLTQSTPTRIWRYFVRDPFHPGFRFRLAPASGAPGRWSAIQPPHADLELISSDVALSGEG